MQRQLAATLARPMLAEDQNLQTTRLMRCCARCLLATVVEPPRNDTQLPACSNCARFTVDCTFYDHVLKEKVSRSYIDKLVQRLYRLQNGDLDGHQASSLDEPSSAYHLTNVRKDHRLVGLQAPLFTNVHGAGSSQSTQATRDVWPFPLLGLPDEPIIGSELHHFLVERYMAVCNAVYPILEDGLPFLYQDPSLSDEATSWSCFVLNMIYAIGCHCLPRNDLRYTSLSQSCYRAAQVYFESVMSELDVEALQAVLLLTLYSLFDPQQGNIGQQVAFAHRLDIELSERDAERYDLVLSRLRKVIFCLGTQVSSVLDRSVGFHSMSMTEDGTMPGTSVQSDHVYSLFALQASAFNSSNDDAITKLEFLSLPQSPLIQVAADETKFLIKANHASAARLLNAYTSDEAVYTVLTSHLAFKASALLLSSSEPRNRQHGYAKGLQVLDRCTLKWPNSKGSP